MRQSASVTGMKRPAAKRLLTSIDVDEPLGMPAEIDRLVISAVLELELESGQRVTLLDDRGWSSGGPNIWAYMSLAKLADTARTVVGPDEPPDGLSLGDADEGYWDQLAANAQAQGVRLAAGDLAALQHDVSISQEIQARISRATRRGG